MKLMWGLMFFLVTLLVFNLYFLIGGPPSSNPGVVYWRTEYDYVIIEVKCWVDVNGTHGFQPIAMVRLVPLNAESVPESYNWVHEAFKLDNRYGYRFIAPEQYYDKQFLFWQSEKTGMIVPDRVLVLNHGFSGDTWWQNYG